MKKSAFITALFVSAGLLAACGDKDEVTNVPGDVADNTAYAFHEFSLDVDYSATSSYEVSFDNEANQTDAEIDDTVNGNKLQGNEAMDELDSYFRQLTFDATTPNDEVIAQVLEVFNLADNFTKFELDVNFHDGTQKEYMQTK